MTTTQAGMITIAVKHQVMDPVAGPQETQIETAESGPGEREIADTLRNLFRQFHLPNGGTMQVEANGVAVSWDYRDFLVPLARRIVGGE